MRKVIFYETAGGKCPAADFLDFFARKAGAKISWVLQLIEELEIVPSVYLKKLINTDEIWEVCEPQQGAIFFGCSVSLTASSLWWLLMPFRRKRKRLPNRT